MLAQIEEVDHAGSRPGTVGVPNTILNRRHWATAGMYASAHLLADQPVLDGEAEFPFNTQRLARIRDKYFIAFLIAYMQRLVLNRFVLEANRLLASPMGKIVDDLGQLRMRFLKFAVGGHFTQVSTRHAVHDYYQLARTGLDVPEAWSEIRHQISDLDAQYSAQQQQQLTNNVAKNVDLVVRVQKLVEWFEIFFVAVYSAHLWDIVSKAWVEGDQATGRDGGQVGGLAAGHLRSWIAPGIALLTGLLTFLLVRPYRSEHKK